MKFGRPDYDKRIVDTENKIPQDEPCMLLRGQDQFAPRLLLMWATELRLKGGDPNMARSMEDHAQAMLNWQKVHGVKTPDMYKESAQLKYIKSKIDELIAQANSGELRSSHVSILQGYMEEYYNHEDKLIIFMPFDRKHGISMVKSDNELDLNDFVIDEDTMRKSFDAKLIVYCGSDGKLRIIKNNIE